MSHRYQKTNYQNISEDHLYVYLSKLGKKPNKQRSKNQTNKNHVNPKVIKEINKIESNKSIKKKTSKTKTGFFRKRHETDKLEAQMVIREKRKGEKKPHKLWDRS